MLQQLYNWTIAWAATPQAEWALFLISIIEVVIFPIPPDILLMAMAVAEPKRAFFFAILCTVGSLIGAMIGYGIGKFGGRPLLQRFFKSKTVDSIEALFNRYDAWAVAIAAFTPVPDKVSTVASGAFNVNFKTFILASLVGRASRFFIVAALFYFWGATIKGWIDRYFDYFSIGLVLLLVFGFLAFRFLKSRARKDSVGNLGDNSSPAA